MIYPDNYGMLIVKIDSKMPFDRALKVLKGKVIKTKQTEILRKRQEFVKKSEAKRTQMKKAIYIQKLKDKEI